MNEEKINIVIVSLNEKFTKNVSRNLADSLEMFYADCHELVVYDLINPKEVIEKCGLEYLKQREKAVLVNISSYLNTVFSISFELLKEYYSYFKNSIIIFLNLPQSKTTKVVNKIDYNSRTQFLKSISNLEIEQEKCLVLKTTKEILKALGEHYEYSK